MRHFISRSFCRQLLVCSWLILLLNLIGGIAVAQDKCAVQFGKVKPQDFAVKLTVPDTGAHAIVVADIGQSEVVANNSGGFGYVFERKLRVYIVDMQGVDAGKFVIPLYASEKSLDHEALRFVRGSSYNLVNGAVVETKLEPDEIFTEIVAKTRSDKKFSMPQLRAGTLFELTYRIESDFLFQFRSWQFQDHYPKLWSEYNAEVPAFFDFVYLKQGYLPMHIDKAQVTRKAYTVRSFSTSGQSSYNFSALAVQKKWVIKNIPAIREEPFTTTINNHCSQIEFQLSSIRLPEQEPIQVMSNWPKASAELMTNELFGNQIDKDNHWLDEVVRTVLTSADSDLDKARHLHAFIRDNFDCQFSSLYASGNLKQVLKKRSGNVADLNLLLLAMLRHEQIETYPVILSTRQHGFVHPVYPLIDRYNYVVCAAKIGGKEYLMDASARDIGFNRLPLDCYNGQARLLTAETAAWQLDADSINERSVKLVTLEGDGRVFRMSVEETPGYYESVAKRRELRVTGSQNYREKLRKSFTGDAQVTNFSIDSLGKLDLPVKLTYDFSFANENADIFYINPMMAGGRRDNPFKSASRQYPIEMPYCIDENYMFNFPVPAGWKIEEMPKPAKILLNETEGLFEYLFSVSDDLVQMRCRLKLNKAVFQPDDYETLRDFFDFVVQKQQEQIVLKRK